MKALPGLLLAFAPLLPAATPAEELPAVFLAPPPPAAKPTPPATPISSGLRQVLAARAAATPTAPAPRETAPGEGVVQLADFEVKAPPESRVVPMRQDPPLLRFARTGIFFKQGNKQGDLGLRDAEKPGAATKEPITRVELAFRIKF